MLIGVRTLVLGPEAGGPEAPGAGSGKAHGVRTGLAGRSLQLRGRPWPEHQKFGFAEAGTQSASDRNRKIGRKETAQKSYRERNQRGRDSRRGNVRLQI